MDLYIPMFFLTLSSLEAPAFKVLLSMHNGFNWKRSIKVCLWLKSHQLSFRIFFMAQFGLIFAYLGYAWFYR